MSVSTPTAVSPRDAAEWLAAGKAILIDVREPDEFKAEHIACAISVPLGSVARLFGDLQILAGCKVIFQCQKGGRGEQACRLMSEATSGHELCNLTGGIEAWKEAGLAVARASPATAISIFRQVQIGAGSLVLLSILAGFAGYTFGFALAGLIAAMLVFAGISGWCGMAMLLAHMPWNRAA
ncbi:MAG: rhodanese-like domain-containing protein [Xanthobacteraceae bacterium]|nr:rhodanese-like domain-containing protein [Xanthobacteraceae bacterium]